MGEMTPEKCLDDLRRLGGSVKAPAYVDDYEYILQYKQYKEVFIPEEEYPNKMKVFLERVRLIASKNQDGSFRVCSIGCGDGLVDNDILSTLATEYPHLKIQYVGIDVSEAYCQLAKDNLKTRTNVEIEVLHQNFLDYSVEKPFDFVVALHSLYYLPSPEGGVRKVLSFLKSNGMAIAALRAHDVLFKPHEALCHSEEKTNLCYSDNLAKTLDSMGVAYEGTSYSYTMDFTPHLKNNFQSPAEKNVLDFMAHVKLELYPKSVPKTFISYLNAISYGKPEKALLDMSVFCYCITKS